MKNQTLLYIALQEYGVKEIPGNLNNPRIDEYFTEIGFDAGKFHEDTSWCSAWMNFVAMKAILPHTGKLNARSWLSVGEPVSTPVPGDVVVLWREDPSSWKGHVGIFINQVDDHIFILGGNQSNMVCIAPYPVSQLLGYRRLSN